MRLLGKFIILLLFIIIMGCNRNSGVFQGYAEGDYTYLASAVAGNLTQIFVSRGDQAVAGQPLFVLDPQPEFSKFEQTKHELDKAREILVNDQKGARETVVKERESQLAQVNASFEYAKKTLKRYQELYKTGAIDKATLDQHISNYETNLQKVNAATASLAEAKLGARENIIAADKATVAAAESAAKQAEWALLQKSVRAPVAAQVFDTLYEQGELIGAGKPVLILLPPKKIKFIFFIPEAVLSKVKIGTEIMVNCDGCKKSYHAHVSYISPGAEFTPPVIFSKDSRDKLVYRIEAMPNLEEATQFHPGQAVDVKIN